MMMRIYLFGRRGRQPLKFQAQPPWISTPRCWVRVFLLLSAVTTLAACQPSLKSDMADYQSRLANVLEQTPVESGSIDYPDGLLSEIKPKASQAASEPPQISLKQFYEMPNCNLKLLIAERNTGLGKVQAPSTRFIYEVKFSQTLGDCQDSLPPEAAPILLQKQQSLRRAWNDLLLNSQELKQALTPKGHVISPQSEVTYNASISGFRYLTQLANSPLSADSSILETQLQAIGQEALPAVLLSSMVYLQQELSQTSDWLRQHQTQWQCPDNRQGTQAPKPVQYLKNVFQLFFIEKIQPTAAKLNKLHYQLLPMLTTLYQNQSALQTGLNQYQVQFEQYQQAMSDHVKLWQGLFKQCGLKPGSR